MKLREYLFGENRPKTYTVVYSTYAGDESTFTNFNIHLVSWIWEYGECEIDHFEQPDKIYLENWNNGGALRHGEWIMYCSTYSLNYEFGVHRVMVEVSGEDFWKVIDDLRAEFVIVTEETDREVSYYLINYCDEKSFIGIMHKGIDA